MVRREFSGLGRPYGIGEEPIKLPLNIGQRHHFENMPDPNKLKPSGGTISVSYTVVYESEQRIVNDHVCGDTPDNRDFIRKGLEAMRDHNSAHENGSISGKIITNKKVLPSARSQEISHRDKG